MSDVDVHVTLELAREAISPSLAERERLEDFARSLAAGQLAARSDTDVERALRDDSAFPEASSRTVRNVRWTGRLGLVGALGAGVLMGYTLRMVQEPAPKNEPPSEAARPVVVEDQGNLGATLHDDTSTPASPTEALHEPNGTGERPISPSGHGSTLAAKERQQQRNVPARGATARMGVRSSSAPASWRSELALLQRAELAVREGTGDEALRILEQLEREGPSAAFREEREALRVMAQCLARLPSARTDASSYVQQRPGSAHVRRVLELCKMDDPGTRGGAQGR